MREALVVLSGGQDSATCLEIATQGFGGSIRTLTFFYGQKHEREIQSARYLSEHYGCLSHDEIEVPVLYNNPKSGLTNDEVDVNEVDPETKLPKSFVPGRNLVFLTSAASFALTRGIKDIFTGVCQTDYSGYPDCRIQTISALETAINLGNDITDFEIHTPLMNLTKAETVKIMRNTVNDRGWIALKHTWTCYMGGLKPCGTCPACVLRAKGFEEAGEIDPAL